MAAQVGARPPAAPKVANPFFKQAAGKSWNAAIPKPTINPGGVMQRPAAQKPAKPATVIKPAPTTIKPQTPAQNPLDATYFGNTSANLFSVNNKITGLGQQSAASSTALQSALGGLAYQQPRDQLKTMQGANARGSLYSSAYGQQQGDLVHNYATRQTAAIASDAARQSAIQQQIDAARSGIPIYNEQEALASAIRMSAEAAKNPALGQPQAVPTGPAPKAPAAGGHYVWNNGQWNLIHAVGPGRWASGPVKAKGKR